MPATIFYEDNDGSFVEQDISVLDIMSGDLAWGVYDNDGDKDLAGVGYDEYLSETVDNRYHSSGFAAEQSFTITATGIETTDTKPVSIYPNPVILQANINIDNERFHALEIRDVTGKVLHQEHIINEKLTIDFSGYDSGIYLVRFVSEHSNHVEKLVVK